MPHNIKVIVQKGACMTDTDVIRSYTHMIGYFDKKIMINKFIINIICDSLIYTRINQLYIDTLISKRTVGF